MAPDRPARPRKRRVLALLVGLALAVLLPELAVRVRALVLGRECSRDAFVRAVEGELAVLDGSAVRPAADGKPRKSNGMVLHPYQGFQIEYERERIARDLQAYAAPENAERFEVLVMGGSVAADFGNWCTYVLRPGLEARPWMRGRPVEIQNWSCAGHKQPQHATGLVWLLSQGYRPDVVVLLDGFNELAIGGQNAADGAYPGYPSWFEMRHVSGDASGTGALHFAADFEIERREANAVHQRALRWGAYRSAILGELCLSAVRRHRVEAQRITGEHKDSLLARGNVPDALRGPLWTGTEAQAEDELVATWERCARAMHALCQVHGIEFVHLLQPSAYDPGSKALTVEEQKALDEGPWHQRIRSGYPKLRAASERLRAAGVNSVDLTGMFAEQPETVYRDGCHLVDLGNRLLNERALAELDRRFGGAAAR
jgi:hypothetical protein